jgi:hypothetical protein
MRKTPWVIFDSNSIFLWKFCAATHAELFVEIGAHDFGFVAFIGVRVHGTCAGATSGTDVSRALHVELLRRFTPVAILF